MCVSFSFVLWVFLGVGWLVFFACVCDEASCGVSTNTVTFIAVQLGTCCLPVPFIPNLLMISNSVRAQASTLIAVSAGALFFFFNPYLILAGPQFLLLKRITGSARSPNLQ